MSANPGKDKSLEQEERIAKIFNAGRTPQSGGGMWKKGDVLSNEYLIECKTTVNPSLTFSVRKDILDKAKHEAQEMHKQGAILAFTIGEGYEDYFVVDTKFIKEYLELKESVANLCAQSQIQLNQIELKAEQLATAQRKGEYEVTDLDKASFQIHKARLTNFIEELKKLM